MAADKLQILDRPKLSNARLVLGFSGWMDGGDVSTGTIEWLIPKLGAEAIAEIDSEDFYILSFPGSMEMSSLFRPHVKIEDGLITAYHTPWNRFYCSAEHNLILFLGREPNFNWSKYCDCIFSLVSQFDVGSIYFIGSVGGLVPHTRDPRLYSSVSVPSMKLCLEPFGVRFTNYEGPSSIVTHLMQLAGERSIPMATLVAEIPSYVQGRIHRCIETMARRLSAILQLKIDLSGLRAMSDRQEERLDETIQEHEDLLERIGKLEDDYDNEVFDAEMGDMKDWLKRRGIQAD